ncbi:hypothetical protein HDZ31DRAFT_68075 [Schizophyllum fasciatum]
MSAEIQSQGGEVDKTLPVVRAAALARAFEEKELKPLTVPKLRSIINEQRDNLREPLPQSLQLSKATKPQLISILLDAKYGFKTRQPRLSFEPGYGVRSRSQPGRKSRAAAEPDSLLTHQGGPSSATSALAPVLATAGHGQPLSGNAPQANPASFGTFLDALETPDSSSTPRVGVQQSLSEVTGPPFDQLYTFAPSPSQTLTIYVRDVRDLVFGEAVLPDRVDISVPVTHTKLGKSFVDWRDVIRQVQGTARRYAKISYSRTYEDDYKIAILQADDVSIEDATILHPLLALDASPTYCLHVDPLKDPVRRHAPSPEIASARETLDRLSASSSDVKVQRPMSDLRIRGRARQVIEEDANARDFEWLQGELRKRDGYEQFKDGKHDARLSYAEVLAQWEFALAFMDEYSGVVNRAYPRSRKRIRKQDIQNVLDRGQNWFRHAKRGRQLYRKLQNEPEIAAAVLNPEARGHADFLGLLESLDKEKV